MRRKYLKSIMTLLIFTMCLTVLAPAAFANETPSIKIPVSVSSTDEQDHKVILEADSPDYPMPEGSVGGFYTLVLKGGETVSLPEIKFSSIGIYTYKIYQEIGDNEDGDSVYNLIVYMTNRADGTGLESMVMLYLVGDSKKHEVAVLGKEYEGDKEDPSEKPSEKPDVSEDPKDPKDSDDDEDRPIAASSQDPHIPQTSDETVIWPYIGLFLSGMGMLLMLGFTMKRKIDNDL